MRKHRAKGVIILGLVGALLLESVASFSAVSVRAASQQAVEQAPTGTPAQPTEEPAPTSTPAQPTAVPTPTRTPVQPTAVPTPTRTPVQPTAVPTPTKTPTQTPSPAAYKLTSPKAKYSKGGQAGIKYHRIKGKKVYKITTYATDSVTLSMSHPTTFSVYGGGSKKEVKNKAVTVSAKGVVKCHQRGKGEKTYTVIQAVSKTTGEKQYIYIYFKKKLSCLSGKKITIYERYKKTLSFDYSKKNLSIKIENKKTAKVNKKGIVSALKKGTTYITAKVKGSRENQVRIKVVVKVEPWIVSAKDKLYDYEDMKKDLVELNRKYPGRSGLSSIGKTYDKREIYCLRIGSRYAKKKLVIDAAIHAREWKNTQIIMRQAEEMLRDYPDFKKRFQNTCIYILPMDNPDGVTIAQYGYKGIRNKKLRKLVKKIGHTKVWKANARGVNLNDNFSAGFTTEKKKKKAHYMGYPGKKAESEKETRALVKFMNTTKPDAVLNLHSTGSIIYWDFNVEGKLHEDLEKLAGKVNSFNKYQLMPKSGSTDAAGGFADWLVYKKGIPSITIETGNVVCPLPHSQFKKIYKENNKMFRWFMTEY